MAYDKKRLTVPTILAMVVGAAVGILAAALGWESFGTVIAVAAAAGLVFLGYALVRGLRNAKQ